jgi:carboxylesterase
MIHTRRRTLMTQTLLGVGEPEFVAPGRGPCVIGLHGFSGTAAELRPLLDRIAADGCAVDATLMPGHGTGAQYLQRSTFGDWVDSARRRAANATARYGGFVLLGFSLGSLVAMQIASENPEGLLGFVAIGNALRLTAYSRIPLTLLGMLGGWLPDLYVVKPVAGDVTDPSARERIVTYDRHPLRAAVEVLRAGQRMRDVVGAIGCPTLVLHGRRDHVCPWQNAKWLAEHLGTRDVKVRIFDRSAHVLACDLERDAVATEVLSFIGRLSPKVAPGEETGS